MSEFLETLDAETSKGVIPAKTAKLLRSFYENFRSAAEHSENDRIFLTFLELVKKELANPFTFDFYHEQIRTPTDYYKFGVEFLRPLIDLSISTLTGLKNVEKMAAQLAAKENVLLLANHQTEADPQMISLILEKHFPTLGEKMIFVAGERVITDPLAIPFSMGCNLLCIYSKRYIDNPPEDKHAKQLHNKRTMGVMCKLLSEGGKCIYIAPSGGRDRPNKEGIFEVAPFDAPSVEMSYLMARKAKRATHFYPLSLLTHKVLPPPADIQIELGENRMTRRAPIHFSFGDEIDMEHIPSSSGLDKHSLRKKRTEMIYNIVRSAYNQLESLSTN